jgi:hypothetical protein
MIRCIHCLSKHHDIGRRILTILTSALDGHEWSASRHSRLITWIRGWVGPRAGPNVVARRKIPSVLRSSNPKSIVNILIELPHLPVSCYNNWKFSYVRKIEASKLLYTKCLLAFYKVPVFQVNFLIKHTIHFIYSRCLPHFKLILVLLLIILL